MPFRCWKNLCSDFSLFVLPLLHEKIVLQKEKAKRVISTSSLMDMHDLQPVPCSRVNAAERGRVEIETDSKIPPHRSHCESPSLRLKLFSKNILQEYFESIKARSYQEQACECLRFSLNATLTEQLAVSEKSYLRSSDESSIDCYRFSYHFAPSPCKFLTLSHLTNSFFNLHLNLPSSQQQPDTSFWFSGLPGRPRSMFTA